MGGTGARRGQTGRVTSVSGREGETRKCPPSGATGRVAWRAARPAHLASPFVSLSLSTFTFVVVVLLRRSKSSPERVNLVLVSLSDLEGLALFTS